MPNGKGEIVPAFFSLSDEEYARIFGPADEPDEPDPDAER